MIGVVPLAIAVDAATGDPPGLWRHIGHPVTWFGAAIALAERRLNTGRHKILRGAVALAAVLATFTIPAFILHGLLATIPLGWVAEALLASTLLAHRSLHEHVRHVGAATSLANARRAVGMIVGRDTATLDEPAIARASIETLSESLSDGVVAPAFWLAVGGLPAIVAYKVANTADSMIGYRNAHFEAFGKTAARLDDVLNIVPSRLTALLVGLAAPRIAPHASPIAADARGHVSPNAGWPEAAFARALGIALGGPRRYAGELVEGHWLNRAGRTATMADIAPALALSRRVGLIQFALYLSIALALWAARA